MNRLAMAVVAALAPAPDPAAADFLTTVRPIRAGAVVAAADIRLVASGTAAGPSRPEEVIGLEARVTLFPGRPIRPGDVGPPALVLRNQIVQLVYARGNLLITTEGRALGRGGRGDLVRAMNLASRTTVVGRVVDAGVIRVAAGPNTGESAR